jgi:hypothetical protein
VVSEASGGFYCRERLLLAVFVFVYILCFHWVYVYYLNREIAGFGFVYDPPDLRLVIFGWLLAFAPSMWMPFRLARASQLAYWILYIVVLIPSMIVPIYADVLPLRDTIALVITLFLGFTITGLSYCLPLFRIRDRMIAFRSFQYLIFLCLLMFGTWFWYVHRGVLSVVSFDAVYDLRENAEQLMTGSYVTYAGMLLSGAIDPFLMAWGLYYKRPLHFTAGALGQLLVYSGWGTKGSLTSIVFVAAFYLLLRGDRRLFGIKLIVSVTSMLAVLAGMYLLIGEDAGIILSFVLFFIFARTYTIQGLLTAQYYDFFKYNPNTHFATVTGINWFVHNPYVYPIGIEVGYYVSGDRRYDAIAHFWASDGIAAWGLPGVLLMSMVCAFVFWILDSAAQRHDPRFSALVTCYAAYNLANIPLFTSLLSGGLGILGLWLYMMPPQIATPVQKESRGVLELNSIQEQYPYPVS